MLMFKRISAAILVLFVISSFMLLPVSASEMPADFKGNGTGISVQASTKCYKCSSTNLTYRGTEYTDMGPDDYGKHHWRIDKAYLCRSCGSVTYVFVGYTTTPPTR